MQYWSRNSEVSFKSLAGKLFFWNIPIKDIQLWKMGVNINDVVIYKYYDMVQNTKLITNVKFEFMSLKKIIANHGKYTWLNDFQFKRFNVWKNNSISIITV